MAKQGGLDSSRGKTFGKLEQVFDDIWWAWGTVRVGPGVSFPRNMALVREAGELVAIHPVMMPDDVQRQIEALGPIKHIVRLGAFHGMDDAAYLEKYGATAWAPEGVELATGARIDRVLKAGEHGPFADGTVFDFTASRSREMALHVKRHGGVLLTCDSVQNWQDIAGVSLLAKLATRRMGFRGRACIGPGWRKRSEPKDGVGFKADFERLLALDWKHLLTAHGPPMRDTARDELRANVAKLYP